MAGTAQSGKPASRYYDGHTAAWNPRDTMAKPGPARPDTPAYIPPAGQGPQGTFIGAAPADGLPASASPAGRYAAHVDRGLYAYGQSHRGTGVTPDAPDGEIDSFDLPDPRSRAWRTPRPQPDAEPEAGA